MLCFDEQVLDANLGIENKKEWQFFSRELRGRFAELFPRNGLVTGSENLRKNYVFQGRQSNLEAKSRS